MSQAAHVLVVGGTRGIGRALARKLASEGTIVSVLGRSRGAVDDGMRAWSVDVADRAQLQRTLEEVATAQGPVSGVVALQRYRGDGDAWSGEIETTLSATRNVIEWASGALEDTGSGKAIVVVSSIAARYVASEQPVSYNMAKAALSHLVRYYAVSLGSKAIRVNGICPGTTVKDESRGFYAEHPEIETLYRGIVPLGRMGTAEDVAELAAFLLSQRSSFITGQNIVIDGGVSLQSHESLARRIAGVKSR